LLKNYCGARPLCWGVVLWLVSFNCIAAEPALEIGPFSKSVPGGTLPERWQPQTFKNIEKHTVYELVKDGNETAVKAIANGSASGLTKALDLDLKAYPILEWRWKVSNLITKSDPKTKAGDDYPARIYITFKYDPDRVSAWQRVKYGIVKAIYGTYPPHAGINYIWDNKLAIGTIVPNAYTDRLRMIVAESGTPNLNQWQTYRRNVYEDYLQAFGEEPPRVSGIAIMTDTDNTGESATAYYGDIRLLAVEK
jgi:Protein of unknown function (DUF3047)